MDFYRDIDLTASLAGMRLIWADLTHKNGIQTSIVTDSFYGSKGTIFRARVEWICEMEKDKYTVDCCCMTAMSAEFGALANALLNVADAVSNANDATIVNPLQKEQQPQMSTVGTSSTSTTNADDSGLKVVTSSVAASSSSSNLDVNSIQSSPLLVALDAGNSKNNDAVSRLHRLQDKNHIVCLTFKFTGTNGSGEFTYRASCSSCSGLNYYSAEGAAASKQAAKLLAAEQLILKLIQANPSV